MKEHLIEVTIMDYPGNILLFTITAPRTFVTINPRHLGFDDEELLNGKDELNILSEIRNIVRGKTIVSYDIKKFLRLCNITTILIHGYIDLERLEPLRRKFGPVTNQIKLPSMVKIFNLRGKFPMRTSPRCIILKPLWKIAEKEVLNVIQIESNYSEQEVLILQNEMEDEFTAIGRTPVSLPRTFIIETQSNDISTTTQLTINTSPMKRLRISTDEDESSIPLLKNIQKKCKMDIHNSTLPTICTINGEEYNIQAIKSTPIRNPQQTLFCQTLPPDDSPGREILKGGRNVEARRNKEH